MPEDAQRGARAGRGAPATVAFVLPSYDGGGAQRVLLTLLRHIDRSRFRPELIVFSADGPLAADLPDGISPHVLDRPRLRAALPALFACLRRVRPDVVFSTMGYVNLALLAMRWALPGRSRLVLREPNMPSISLPTLNHGGMIATGYRLLYPRADAIVCQSSLMMRELVEDYGVPASLVRHLANPVDEARLRSAIDRLERALGPGRRYVACGSLIHQKGFDRLLPLFVEMPAQDRLTILGAGKEDAALRAQCAQLGLDERVHFAGFTRRPWLWFAAADAVLVPSRWEGQSNVALEALACGAPVIATPESGGIDEVAKAASSGAVTIAEIGAPFVAAMQSVKATQVEALRPSLLPAVHALDEVMERFHRMLDG